MISLVTLVIYALLPLCYLFSFYHYFLACGTMRLVCQPNHLSANLITLDSETLLAPCVCPGFWYATTRSNPACVSN